MSKFTGETSLAEFAKQYEGHYLNGVNYYIVYDVLADESETYIDLTIKGANGKTLVDDELGFYNGIDQTTTRKANAKAVKAVNQLGDRLGLPVYTTDQQLQAQELQREARMGDAHAMIIKDMFNNVNDNEILMESSLNQDCEQVDTFYRVNDDTRKGNLVDTVNQLEWLEFATTLKD